MDRWDESSPESSRRVRMHPFRLWGESSCHLGGAAASRRRPLDRRGARELERRAEGEARRDGAQDRVPRADPEDIAPKRERRPLGTVAGEDRDVAAGDSERAEDSSDWQGASARDSRPDSSGSQAHADRIGTGRPKPIGHFAGFMGQDAPASGGDLADALRTISEALLAAHELVDHLRRWGDPEGPPRGELDRLGDHLPAALLAQHVADAIDSDV
jgi:hypothetical protein